MDATVQPRPGYVVEVERLHVGEKHRTGEILEVLGPPGHEHFRVRWDDGRESLFFPAGNTIVRPARVPPRP